MTKPKINSVMGRLRKMIKDGEYVLPERFAPVLHEMGYIELKRWAEVYDDFLADCSEWVITEKGKKAYFDWAESSSLDWPERSRNKFFPKA